MPHWGTAQLVPRCHFRFALVGKLSGIHEIFSLSRF